MTNYVHAIVMDTGTKNGSERGHANIFQMRAQIEFWAIRCEAVVTTPD